MKSITTDSVAKPLRARDDEASAIDKDTVWLLFQRLDKLELIRKRAHRHYTEMTKKLQRDYYVKMTRLERDISRLQAGIKTIVGANDVRSLRVEYDATHAPADATGRQLLVASKEEDARIIEAELTKITEATQEADVTGDVEDNEETLQDAPSDEEAQP